MSLSAALALGVVGCRDASREPQRSESPADSRYADLVEPQAAGPDAGAAAAPKRDAGLTPAPAPRPLPARDAGAIPPPKGP